MIIGGLDLETTGLLAPEHRIIEVCLITCEWDGTHLKEQKCLTQRLDPKRPIDAKAEAVHKITSADLIGKPTFEIFAPQLVRELNECDYVVAHNGDEFDYLFLAQELRRVNVEFPDFETFDTMQKGRWATEMGMVPSLKALCFASGVEYDETKAHAAEYDVRRMLQCLEFGIKRRVFVLPEIEQISL